MKNHLDICSKNIFSLNMNLIDAGIDLSCERCGEFKVSVYRVSKSILLCKCCGPQVFPHVIPKLLEKGLFTSFPIEYFSAEEDKDDLH